MAFLEQAVETFQSLPQPVKRTLHMISGGAARFLFVAPYYVPSVVKGCLVYLPPHPTSDTGAGAGVAAGEPEELWFQFNPTEIEDRKVAKWETLNLPGLNTPPSIWTGNEPRELSFTLLFDLSEEYTARGLVGRVLSALPPVAQQAAGIAGAVAQTITGTMSLINPLMLRDKAVGVMELCNRLRKCAEPMLPIDKWAGRNPLHSGRAPFSQSGLKWPGAASGDLARAYSPPILKFVYGWYIDMLCVMPECNISYKMFDHRGTPIVATADITLKEVPREQVPVWNQDVLKWEAEKERTLFGF